MEQSCRPCDRLILPCLQHQGFSEGGFQAPRLDPGKWEESGEQQASPKAPADENLANQLATLLKNLKEKKTVAGGHGLHGMIRHGVHPLHSMPPLSSPFFDS